MTRRDHLASIALSAAQAQDDPAAGLPDFSHAGYRSGGVPLPRVPVRVTLRPESGDATTRIQHAIDELAARPEPRRGAILLTKGQYDVGGTLRIQASHIVLRGEEDTTIFATGTKQRTVIEIAGPAFGSLSAPVAIEGDVPVGGHRIRVASAKELRPGQLIVVRRHGNRDWIREIGMDRIRPRPGDEKSTRQWQPFDLDFERFITAIDGSVVTIDAPVLCAIEKRWGGGQVLALDDRARVRECGVENLRGVSAFDRSVTALHEREKYFSDEAHAWDFIAVDHAVDCWVRGVSARHFGSSCVSIRRARQVTVEDCENGEMVSVITGSRRYPFSIVNGQRVLIARCQSDTGRHDFVVGARVAGPNVFLDCTAGRSFAHSEPHHRWSVGGLYDNVKASIAIQDRQYMGTGHGWAGANYVVWNCEGPIICQKPPTADNWVIGQVGDKSPGSFPPRPEATWRSFGRHVMPRSLYLSQLSARAR